MKFISFAIVAATLVGCFSVSAEPTAQPHRILHDWIDANLHIFVDRDGNRKLFSRRGDLRAAVYSEIPNVDIEAKEILESFASAIGIKTEYTRQNPNILVYVTSSINLGDKPNPELLKKMGLSGPAYTKHIGKSEGWSSGCGVYTFVSLKNEPALSLAIADRSLGREKSLDCLVEGIIRAFGMRGHETKVIRRDEGYIQYLYLARAFKKCDSEITPNRAELEYRKALTLCAHRELELASTR